MENINITKMYGKLFSICKATNDYILQKEKDDDLDFIDHYMFQTTSYLIAIIHENYYFKESKSLCKMFLYRSLIECVSVLNMYLAGDITEDAKELINKYCYLADYSIYRKYKDELDGIQFDFEQIEENFKKTKNIYRENYDEINNNDFKNKIKSQLPFITEDYTFDDLVQKYCGDFYQYYRLLSVMIHPHDPLKTTNLKNELDLPQLEARLLLPFLDIMVKCYPHLEKGESISFQEEKEAFNVPYNKEYITWVYEQEQALDDLANMVYAKHGENQVSIFFREFGYTISSMALDRVFDYPEIIKCKFKMSIELAAMFYYTGLLPHTVETEYLGKLISKHTRIKLYEIVGEDTTDLWKDAYECFKKCEEDILFDDFKKKFSASLGFIPEKKSISKFVYDLIDAVSNGNETLAAHMKMVYDEAQLLSHANGYMITANTGAFMEYSSVIVFMDSVIDYLIFMYYKIYGIYNATEGEGKLNKFVYDIKKYRKRFKNAAVKKASIDKVLNMYTMLFANEYKTNIA